MTSRPSGKTMRRRFGKPSAAKGGETKGLPILACSFPFKSSIFHSTRVHLGPPAWKPKILMPGGSSRSFAVFAVAIFIAPFLVSMVGPASGCSAASPGGTGAVWSTGADWSTGAGWKYLLSCGQAGSKSENWSAMLDKCGGKSKVSSQKRFSWMGSGKGTCKGEAQELAGFSRPTWLGTCHGLSCDSSVW